MQSQGGSPGNRRQHPRLPRCPPAHPREADGAPAAAPQESAQAAPGAP